jgi:hypothetical protein
MLTHDRLMELYRELADVPVLSVYIDGNQHDPAERRKWRLQLEQGLAATREALADRERASFAAAERLVLEQLEGLEAFLPSKAYVAFATPNRLLYGEAINISMPQLVRWGNGIAAAPYVRGLKQERPVIVVLLDSERARVFVYQDGSVRETEDLRADTFQGDLTDLGGTKRATTVTGHRGTTATDAGQRYHDVASERMVKEVAGVAAQRAGDHGFVVLGGTPEMEKWLRSALPKSLEGRVLVEPALELEMTAAEVREAVGASATELTGRWQLERVQFVFDQARAGLRGAMGYRETEKALEEMRVDTLFLSRSRTRDDPADSDRLIGLAFAGRAHVDEVGGAAGDLLDLEAEGMAARLRYRVGEPQTGHPEEMESPEAQAHRARQRAARSGVTGSEAG